MFLQLKCVDAGYIHTLVHCKFEQLQSDWLLCLIGFTPATHSRSPGPLCTMSQLIMLTSQLPLMRQFSLLTLGWCVDAHLRLVPVEWAHSSGDDYDRQYRPFDSEGLSPLRSKNCNGLMTHMCHTTASCSPQWRILLYASCMVCVKRRGIPSARLSASSYDHVVHNTQWSWFPDIHIWLRYMPQNLLDLNKLLVTCTICACLLVSSAV